jgi:hypothetical protein
MRRDWQSLRSSAGGACCLASERRSRSSGAAVITTVFSTATWTVGAGADVRAGTTKYARGAGTMFLQQSWVCLVGAQLIERQQAMASSPI